MAGLSNASEARLETCDNRIQLVIRRAAAAWPGGLAVLEGHRGEEAQHAAFVAGKSKLDWPNGNHNSQPSRAVDAAPLDPRVPGQVNWKDTRRFYLFGGFVLGLAAEMGIPLRWGGDWDRDSFVDDQKFNDLVHFELVG